MRYRVTFAVPTGATAALASTLIRGQELEAEYVEIGANGVVSLWNAGKQLIIAYAPGAWRTCAEVGAFEAALAPAPEKRNENTGRGSTAGQSQAT